MKGCRPLSEDEILQASESFQGRYAVRNRCLFVLGVLCGFRVSELLSLRIRDVVENNLVRNRVTVPRRSMKGKKEGRTVYLPKEGRLAVLDQVRSLCYPGPDEYLFRSQAGSRPISRAQASRVLTNCFKSCGIAGQVATHSLRKTFANRTYSYFLRLVAKGEPVDPFTETSLALGHSDPASTRHYLSFRDDLRREAAQQLGRLFNDREEQDE